MTRFAGIIGHPVAHSLSPACQRAAFRHSGLDVEYERWDTPLEALAARMASLRDPRYLGANVTIPHKESVRPFLDELGGQSSRVGAVNTVVNREGRLFGFNTDGPGFVSALRREARFDPAGAAVLLVGAGGAARGIAFALAEARAGNIGIWNRTPDRAERLAQDVPAATGAAVHAVPGVRPGAGPREHSQDGPDPGGYDIVVNCTSIGMHGTGTEARLPCSVAGARPGALFVDIVYAPLETAWLRAAEAAGLTTLGGLPMLVYQGGLSFELWTGVPAPIEVMFDAARAALIARDPIASEGRGG